ncbi:MAG: tyrosine-type recombinase/integrase, partial [Rhodocyclales bacterium]|nr:tyrosine-type recombinase/integrase [Rhodocyclales bacterium]
MVLTKKSRFPRRPLGDARDPEGFAQLTAEYCEHMAVRNFSSATIAVRRRVFDLFIIWALERGLCRPGEITRPILERYQRYLFYFRRPNGKPLTWRGQVSRLGPLKSFFSWLTRQNRILYNPAADLDMPLAEKRLPKAVLTISEAEIVLAQADIREPMGIRDRAILETFYSTGMRRMELVNLQLVDLDCERGTVTIRQGKGKKDRVVPIGERAIAWLGKYLEEVRPLLVVDG